MQVKRTPMLPGNGCSVGDMSALPTPELVALAQAGNLEAFDPLYRRYAGRVLGYAVSKLYALYGHSKAAEEVAARTWLVAVTKIGRYEGHVDGDPFRAWLFGIARVECIDLYRGFREIPAGGTTSEDARVWLDHAQVTSAIDTADDEDVSAEKRDMLAQLHEAVDELPDDAHKLMRLYLEGADLGEIAERTGWDYQRVNKLWQKTKDQLRARLLDDEELFADTDAVRQAAMTLPESLRQVALMRLDGMRSCDVVAATGLDRQSVCRKWREAKHSLRRRLIDTPKRSLGEQDTAKLRQLAQNLPERARQIALMRLDGMRQRDIIHATGLTQNTVQHAWTRARQAFTRHGIPVPA
ncbi:MAG TPA: sigma-70 family RNA polymerase sigma factor [Candidatus Limnocylindrales bacterium]|nr:sigma-70 family RNA polymerase sigma factor [Candidatus Limnocylindrales bacterium]